MLKIVRIAVSLIVFAVLTAGMVSIGLRMPHLWAWLEQIQLGSAIAAMSLTVFALWMLITLIFGRIYCSSVCPAGTLMDICSRAAGRGRLGREYRYRRPVPELRYLSLAIWAVGLVAGIALISSILDPLSVMSRICNGLVAPLIGMLPGAAEINSGYAARLTVASALVDVGLLIVIAFASARTGRGLCNSICPIGAILGLVSRYSIFQMDIDTDLCTQCRRCEDVCKSCCIDLTDHVVDGSRCVNCFNCINVCPNKAIRYTTDRKRLATPLMQRIPDALAKGPEANPAETSIEIPERIEISDSSEK